MAGVTSSTHCETVSIFTDDACASIALSASEPAFVTGVVQIIECEAILTRLTAVLLPELSMEFELQELHIHLAVEEWFHIMGHQFEDLFFRLVVESLGFVDEVLDVKDIFLQGGDAGVNLLLDFIVVEIIDPFPHDDQFHFIVC